MARRILVYGDTNVWGGTEYDEHGRLGRNERWTGRLEGLLAGEFEVVEAGYPGRCAGSFEKAREIDSDYDGREHYEIFFKSASPIDLVVIALGTNDLRKKYERPVGAIVDDLLWFGGWTRHLEDYNGGKMPRILYVLPHKAVNQPGWYEAEEGKRGELCATLKERTTDHVDLGTVGLTGDGVNFSETGHEDVARRVAEQIKEIFKKGR